MIPLQISFYLFLCKGIANPTQSNRINKIKYNRTILNDISPRLSLQHLSNLIIPDYRQVLPSASRPHPPRPPERGNQKHPNLQCFLLRIADHPSLKGDLPHL